MRIDFAEQLKVEKSPMKKTEFLDFYLKNKGFKKFSECITVNAMTVSIAEYIRNGVTVYMHNFADGTSYLTIPIKYSWLNEK